MKRPPGERARRLITAVSYERAARPSAHGVAVRAMGFKLFVLAPQPHYTPVRWIGFEARETDTIR